jgi:hypothetical protein
MSYTEEIIERRIRLNKERMEGRKFEEPIYTTGVAAKKLGVSPHTLRLYEAEGLIIPYRTDTGRGCTRSWKLKKFAA